MNKTTEKLDKLYSASTIVKQSAKQLYYVDRNEKIVTPRMLVGDEYAKSVSGKYKEMRNFISFIHDGQKNVIFFSFDEIIIGNEVSFIEHKYIENKENVEQWMLDISAIQLAFYYSLHKVSDNHQYVTANFAVQNGAERNELYIEPSPNEKAVLNFGGDMYIINVKNPECIVDFYIDKVIMSKCWQTAVKWEESYHHKDYEILSMYFTYTKQEQQ